MATQGFLVYSLGSVDWRYCLELDAGVDEGMTQIKQMPYNTCSLVAAIYTPWLRHCTSERPPPIFLRIPT